MHMEFKNLKYMYITFQESRQLFEQKKTLPYKVLTTTFLPNILQQCVNL